MSGRSTGLDSLADGRWASLSIDLDNHWAYLKAMGDPGWRDYPSYLACVVPRILNVLKARGLEITIFVVGRDAQFACNRDALASISEARHRIGNHSLQHDIWLRRYTEQQVNAELAASESLLFDVTGQHPRGFRAPGFSLSEATLRVLARRGYKYDASVLPSFLGPLTRAYYLAMARLDRAERERVKQLFGGWREGLLPLNPYCWRVDGGALIEIPVTTFPVVRTPLHFTYVMYLAGYSRALARSYFSCAIKLCRHMRVTPSILLHPLDFLGGEEVTGVASFPGMRLNRPSKLSVLEDCLDTLQAERNVVSLDELAAIASAGGDLPILDWPSLPLHESGELSR